MDDYAQTIAPRSRLFQLMALGFGHPLEEFHRVQVEGGYDRALLDAAAGAGVRWSAPADPSLNFADFEADYIRLFRVGRRGRPVVPLNAGDHDALSQDQGRPEFLLQYSDWYRHFGLKIDQDGEANELPDHLVCQLEFMAWLAHLEDGSHEKPSLQAGYRRAQQDFLCRHLLPFLEVLVAALQAVKERHGGAAHYLSLVAGVLEVVEQILRVLDEEMQDTGRETEAAAERIDAVNLWG